MKYVFKHGNQYLYQRAVPNDLLGSFGKKTIKQSLKTNDKSIATGRALRIAKEHDALFASLRGKGSSASIASEARKLLDPNSYQFTFDEEYIQQGREHGDTIRDLELSELKSLLSDRAVEGDIIAQTAFKMMSSKQPFLSEVLDDYFVLKGIKADSSAFKHVHRSVNFFIKVSGDKPIDQYSKSDARAFRDRYVKEDKVRTGKRNQSDVQNVFSIMMDELDINLSNPFQNLKWPPAKEKNKRVPFNEYELLKIASCCKSIDDDMRWLVALQINTGCRLAEIVGLSQDDLDLENDLPYVRIRSHPWRPLKSETSERAIPLVGTSLWAAQRALKNCDGQFIFSRYITSDMENNKATHASNSLNKWLRTLVTGKTTHSFRHALADRLRNADCSEEVVAEILGHSRAGMTKNYGKGFSLEIKQKWLGKIVADNKL